MSDHAQRLREMAERRKFASQEFRLGWIEEGFHPQNPQLTSRIEKDAAEIAALLAGAAALEAVGHMQRFAEEMSNDRSPVLMGFSYQIQAIIDKHCTEAI